MAGVTGGRRQIHANEGTHSCNGMRGRREPSSSRAELRVRLDSLQPKQRQRCFTLTLKMRSEEKGSVGETLDVCTGSSIKVSI